MSQEKNRKTTVIAAGAAILIAIIGVGTAVYALTVESDKTTSTESSEVEHSHEGASKATVSSKEASATIAYTGNGFEETSYTVKAGETVRVENNSSVEFYFTTGDHHNHDTHSPLNVGVIVPGEASSFVAPKAGIYNFHNHEDERQAGELIVQD